MRATLPRRVPLGEELNPFTVGYQGVGEVGILRE